MMKALLATFVLVTTLALPATAAWLIEAETGSAFSSYNDVAIPGDSGTRFSIQDLDNNSSLFLRLKTTWEINRDHALSFTFAPLRLDATGLAPKVIDFFGHTFAAGDPLQADYRFDTYRLTWRYTLVDNPEFIAKLGLTGLIRDAAIRLHTATDSSERKNTGFVPLVSFSLQWFVGDGLSLLIDGDALAAPQGRAEDILLALQYNLEGKYFFRAGWRFIEGGSDNDSVYTFAWINMITFGAGLRL